MDRKRPLVTYLVLGSALSLSVWAAVFMPRRTVVSTTPPPVVLLTGYADTSDAELRAAGAIAVLGKPVEVGTLLETLRRCCEG